MEKLNSDRSQSNNQLDNKFEPIIDTWSEIDTVIESIDNIPKGDPTGVVLSTIEGPIMDYTNPTRNNRLYPKSLCQAVIHSDYVKELIDNKCFLGEADHPEDNRLTVHFPYVSHAIRDIREDTSRGCYIATIDILDTPYGRILETLRRYGTKLGISSRGAGNVITKNGVPMIDESTYIFVTFDIVHLPGVAKARLTDVNSTNESLCYDKDKLESLTSIFNSYIKSSDQYDDESSLDEIIEVAISKGDYQTLNYYQKIFNALNVRLDLLDKINKYLNRDDSNLVNSLLDELSKNQIELDKATKALADISSSSISNEDYKEELKSAKEEIKKLESNILRCKDQIEDLTISNAETSKIAESLNNRVKNITRSNLELINSHNKELDDIVSNYEDTISKLSDKIKNYEDILNSYKAFRCNQLGVDIKLLNQYKDLNTVKDIESVLSKIKVNNTSPQFSNYPKEVNPVVETFNKSDTLVKLVKSLKS